MTPGARPLLIFRVLDVTEHEHVTLGLARLQRYLEAVRRNRCPTTGDRVLGNTSAGHVGFAVAVVQAEETLAVRVEAGQLGVDVVKREVVAALAVLGLVVNRAAFDLDFTRARNCAAGWSRRRGRSTSRTR